MARALAVHKTLGELHSYRVTNILHLGLQKGIEDKVLETLEEWCEVVQHAPDEVTAHVDTRLLFDVMYQEHFVRPGDTIGGFDFSTVPRIISPSGLWIPKS